MCVRNKIFDTKKILLLLLLAHLLFCIFLQANARIGGDGIFTYTLANNPYSFEYIDSAYKKLPQNNGWISAHVLRENYILEDYDRFNYSSVYFHQRIDNHPLLYYSMVHTICSFFPYEYSKWFTMVVNLVFIFGMDVLIVRLFDKMGNGYAVVPFVFLFLLTVMQKIYILPRMYMALSFFCFWYLYLHYQLLGDAAWKRSYLVQMICCIFLGSQTHYYFYVYAAALSGIFLIYLLFKKEKYKLFNYLYSGITGIALSWIVFPWIIWHILFNQMQKHTTINAWSAEKLKGFVFFLNEQLFNGRGVLAILILFILFLTVIFLKKRKRMEISFSNKDIYGCFALGSALIYSFIIYILDEDNWYYMTPLYVTFIVGFSILLIGLINRIVNNNQGGLVVSLAALCVIMVLSISETTGFVTELLKTNRVSEEFYRLSTEHKNYDCIFVEKGQDNLFQGYFLHFGDYDEFKKISLESFMAGGISEEDRAGRKSNSGLIIYAPAECILDKADFEFLGSDGLYSIYKTVEG